MNDNIVLRIQQTSSLLDGIPTPPPFVEDALCAQTDPEAFFPEQGASTRAAKTICGSCQVVEQCLEYAFATNQQHGIWGGLTTFERNRVSKGEVA
jgi:WhiB family transcriptional regulator, redox-sensing transcriptional regulator